jgi:uncharacterized membrane protein YfcA
MEIILLSILCLFASTAGTITGFGTSTIIMPFVMMFFPVQEALFFVALLHWVTGLTRLVLFREGFNLKLVLSFGIAGMITSYYGALMAFHIDETLLTRGVASFLLAYSLFLIYAPQFKLKFSIASSIGSGLVSGFLAGLFGIGGAIRAAFLSAYDFPKAVYLANSALILVLIDSTRVITYLQQGARFDSICSPALLVFYMLISMIGVKLGERLVRRIPQHLFRYFVAGLLLILGLKLLL